MIGIGTGMNQSDCLAWINTHGLSYLVLADPSQTTYPLFGNGYIPFNALLNADRELVYSDSGYSGGVWIPLVQQELAKILRLDHVLLKDTEDTVSDREVLADIRSLDSIVRKDLVYRVDGGSWVTVDMSPNRAEYVAHIPAQPSGTTVDYYLHAEDDFGRVRYNPEGGANDPATYFTGPDVIPPTIDHDPITEVPAVSFPVTIQALVEDNLGVDHVDLEYDLGSGPVTIPMTEVRDGTYEADIDEPVQVGDSVDYRIIATDASAAANQTYHPASGTHTIDVIDRLPVFIWDLDESNSSAAAIETACDANGITALSGAQPQYDLMAYQSIFVLLGTYSNNYALSASEGQELATYLDGGGNLYMEGGDTWAYDTQTQVHPYFHINGLNDGSGDTGPINGQGGTFTEGLGFAYSGDNNYMDRLAPTSGGVLVWQNGSPVYGNGVVYDGGTYRTIGTSFEFRGLADATYPNTRAEVMRRYLVFFGLLDEPTPTPSPTMAPTETPEPTATWTPELPTPTPTAEHPFGVRLELPAMAHPGEGFHVTGYLDNPDGPRTDVPTFFILEIFGEFWFWPSWSYYSPTAGGSIDFRMEDVPSGEKIIEVIPSFVWPDTGETTVTGLYFYGAMLNDELTEIDGEMAMQTWGYGPSR